ncbi:MAG: pseudouridine synthase [Firmicutes bacterium]|nr:pseudouridine synthase [Bacillota bacterium]MDY3715620.1 pseudouridine synthase [Blautia sp.]
MRLNKYLSDAGVCSRREADRLVEEGKILVDGVQATLGMQVTAEQEILVNGKKVEREEKKILLVFHKPRGVECTTSPKVKNNVISYIGYPIRVYYVGRLDKDSEGLLLLTNEGELVNKIMRAGNCHEKEYVVTVDKPITREFIQKMKDGVPVLGTVTRKCQVFQTGKRTFQIILTQGMNRQIRRMCEYLGYRVKRLKRVRVMNICLGDLPVGKYREATAEEMQVLREMIRDSSETTVKRV